MAYSFREKKWIIYNHYQMFGKNLQKSRIFFPITRFLCFQLQIQFALFPRYSKDYWKSSILFTVSRIFRFFRFFSHWNYNQNSHNFRYMTWLRLDRKKGQFLVFFQQMADQIRKNREFAVFWLFLAMAHSQNRYFSSHFFWISNFRPDFIIQFKASYYLFF